MSQRKPDLFSCDLKYLVMDQKPSASRSKPSHSHWLASAFIAVSVIIWIGSEPNASISVGEPNPLPLPTLNRQSINYQSFSLSQGADTPDRQGTTGSKPQTELIISTDLIQEVSPIEIGTSFSMDLGIATEFEDLQGDIEELYINSNLDLELTKVIPKKNWLTVDIKSGQTLSSIFRHYKVASEHTHNLSRTVEGKVLNHLRTGPNLKLLIENNQLLGLRYNIDVTDILDVKVFEDGYQTLIEKRAINIKQREVSGVIKGSLFRTASKVGLSDQFILHLVSIFRWNIDFNRDLQPGDKFAVIFEEKFVDGRKIATGSILAADFTVSGNRYSAIRHVSEDGSIGYYASNGQSLKRAFLRSPVKFSRISSGFSKRFHPVLKKWKQHKGVDYAARSGTPIQATADGVINRRGRNGGYGKSIEIRHGKSYSTLYAHLSRYAKGIKSGSRIKQGQVIGYVGRTGMATGPHLHYEFRINGVHKNPLSVDVPRALPVAGDERNRFMASAAEWDLRLDSLR